MALGPVLDHWEVPGQQPGLASSILGQSRAPQTRRWSPQPHQALSALSGCPSFHLGPISFAFGQEYAVSVGAGKTAAGAGSCRQAWLGPSREGSSDEGAAWPFSSHQMELRRLPEPPPPCPGFYLWVASGAVSGWGARAPRSSGI